MASTRSSSPWGYNGGVFCTQDVDDLIISFLTPEAKHNLRLCSHAARAAVDQTITSLEGMSGRRPEPMYLQVPTGTARGTSFLDTLIAPNWTGLQRLRLSEDQLSTTLDERSLMTLATRNKWTSLTSLSIQILNVSGPLAAVALAAGGWPHLTELQIIGQLHVTMPMSHANPLFTPALAVFAPWKLKKLSLRSMGVCNIGASFLASTVHWELVDLDLSGCHVGPEGTTALTEAPWFINLQRLDLSFNLIGVAGARAVGVATAKGCALEELNLNKCHLEDEGLIALAGGSFPHLSSLNLASNALTHFGITAATTLCRNMHSLTLRANILTTEAVYALAHAPMLGLHHLNIMCCGMSRASAVVLLRLANWPQLETLHVGGVDPLLVPNTTNAVGDEGIAAMAIGGMERWKNMRYVQMAACEISDLGAEIMSRWPWPKLERLYLPGNYAISDKGAIELAASDMPNLKCLHLARTKVGSKGAMALEMKWPELRSVMGIDEGVVLADPELSSPFRL